MEEVYHIPAMLEPTLDGLNIQPGGTYVDLTFGGGGHSRGILERMGATGGRLFSFDQDMDAYANRIDDPRWQFVHSNFRYLRNWMDYYGVMEVDGILADLGVSFHHFDSVERGFSFRFAAPLDMRMNRQQKRRAAQLIAEEDEESLARVLYLYGELKNGRRLANRICRSRAIRPIETTDQLVAVVLRGGEPPMALPTGTPIEVAPNEKKDLARLFQALRIELNDEMGALREMLCAARALLRPGGRIAILTYHSLEDRLVKNFFRSGNMEGEIEKDFYGNIVSPFRVIEKGRMADADEVERNPRSRSAKLRVAARVVPSER
ncbi:MAG: 16S rRNA (cytosine(1402)-N(4))-methyltransferase RsmH [Paludibacteraceae bacterium]|nr:16S rRNA (cytosine(1402)-N(4))-methyltransferase RsmH [Paludibacteraceae bacterium]